jgi:hypothetical protein
MEEYDDLAINQTFSYFQVEINIGLGQYLKIDALKSFP